MVWKLIRNEEIRSFIVTCLLHFCPTNNSNGMAAIHDLNNWVIQEFQLKDLTKVHNTHVTMKDHIDQRR